MSLLDGLQEHLSNEIYDGLSDAVMEAILDFDMSMEAATDEVVGISATDVDAILDNDDPDNIAADVTTDDDADDDVIIEEEEAIEAAINAILDLEQDVSVFDSIINEADVSTSAQADDASLEPPDFDSATEDSDEGDSLEDDLSDDDSNLQSLLDNVFQ